MPGVSSLSGMTSVTEARNPPTHHDTSSSIRVTALLRDTVCSSTINSRPCNTVTTNVLSGGIPSTLPPPKISSSTHYHAVVCNSATCLGDRVITTPCPTPQGVTSDVFDLSPPHQSTSCPKQYNQAPREDTSPSSAQLASREDLNSAIASVSLHMQDMLTNLHTQIKEEMARPLNAQHTHTHNTPRRNKTSRPTCQCGSSPPRELSPTPSVAPENLITARLHQEKMLQNLIKASEVKFDGKDSQDYAPWKRALQKN